MVHYEADYQFGTEQEKSVLDILREFFKRDIKKMEERYSKFDFQDDEYVYEMKSRKNNYSKYATTMITENKVEGTFKKLILIFNFTDGIYFIEYDKEKFSKYERIMFSRAGFKSDEKSHLLIDIKDLVLIYSKK